MRSLLIRNLIFTILQPGIIAGLIPYLIERDTIYALCYSPFSWNQMVSLVVIAAGLGVLLHCVYLFAKVGAGTLSPAFPTKVLVVKGLYHFVRNPMYIGVMMILIGEAVFASSFKLYVYAGFIFILFNLFIIFIEEPRLKKDFGETYLKYCEEVGRWY
jgi:protein-S-isoprenylcysteine O-methyltransferase Ste14